MSAIKQYEEIRAWQSARELVRRLMDLNSEPRFRNDFPLRDQTWRAATSVMANIAEGFGRGRPKEFAYFLNIARGSVMEVQSLLYVALDAGYIDQKRFDEFYDLSNNIAGMIHAFIKYLRTPPTS